jgi:hypothetical protein
MRMLFFFFVILFFGISCSNKKSNLKMIWLSTNVDYKKCFNKDSTICETSVYFIYNIQIVNNTKFNCVFFLKNIKEKFRNKINKVSTKLWKQKTKIPPHSRIILEFISEEKIKTSYEFKTIREKIINPSKLLINNINLFYYDNLNISKIKKSKSHFIW